MKVNVKVPRDADCKILLREILAELKRRYGHAIDQGILSESMVGMLIKAIAWEKMHAIAGPHVGRAVDALTDAIIEHEATWPSS